LRVCWISFFVWDASAAPMYTSCVIMGALRFFNKTFITHQKI
jgi:hypothetical protein